MGAELFYRKLMSVVDDYGRFEANLKVLRARLYAQRIEETSIGEIQSYLDECSGENDEELVEMYEVNGKQYLEVKNFGQQIRAASKCPPPPGVTDEFSKSGYVYFIMSEASGRIKIGFTVFDPSLRLAHLQTASADKLKLISYVKGDKRLEASLHAKFSAYRLNGEWFEPNEEIVSHIWQMQEGAGKCVQMGACAPSRASTAPTTPSTTPSTTPISGEVVAGKTEGPEMDPGQLADWAEARYAKHPKKTNKRLALAALKKYFGVDEKARELFEKNHDLWCETEDWRKNNGRFAPPLASPDDSGFVPDGGWKYPPASAHGRSNGIPERDPTCTTCGDRGKIFNPKFSGRPNSEWIDLPESEWDIPCPDCGGEPASVPPGTAHARDPAHAGGRRAAER